jgi:hypothetical protein
MIAAGSTEREIDDNGDYVEANPNDDMIIVGGIVLVGSIIFSVIRPFKFHPKPKTAMLDPANFNIALLPDANTGKLNKVGLSYSFSY